MMLRNRAHLPRKERATAAKVRVNVDGTRPPVRTAQEQDHSLKESRLHVVFGISKVSETNSNEAKPLTGAEMNLVA